MSGPSGVGKGSVVRLLLSRDPRLVFSVSATTRPPRPGEEGGRDYVFLSEEEFLRLVGRGAFLEHAEVFGNRYGTLAGPVDEARRSGRDVVLDVDVQGARAVRERAPDAVLVFLVPPSLEELARRLRVRATEDRAEVARRLARAEAEMAEASRFDHVVVNDDLFRAADEILAMIDAYRRGDTPPRSVREGTPEP